MPITEIKHHLDGRIERFTCDVVQLLPGNFAIVRYVGQRDKPLQDGPLSLPAGEIHTLAYFWEGRNFLVYKLAPADGILLGYRFDVCQDVCITRDKIEFVDLLLDLWADPAGKIHVLDEDEVDAHITLGLLTQQQLTIVERTKRFLLENYREILAEIAQAT